MSLTLGTIVSAVRGLHPAFDRTRVPDTVLASALSDYQNTLIGLAVLREKTFASQSIGIALAAGAVLAEDADHLVDLSATGVPFTSTTSGYLVTLDASGNPTIDTTSPIMIAVDQAVDLPIVLAVIGGTVRYTDEGTEKLCITDYGRRFNPPWFPAVYFVDQRVALCGASTDWDGITSIELRVTPFAPALTALDSYFLVPDGAKQTLVAYAASVAAERVAAFAQGDKNPVPDVAGFTARYVRAETHYLSTLRISKRAKHTTFQAGYDEATGWP